jgi:crotonobetainyl-CoA:carnitine CoA-transferase CaiB-like acyl-CoA transferase|tara:strand:- start:5821 stop:7089 length:1269 start_codon:yes stop_codon:yes gene_type:complete
VTISNEPSVLDDIRVLEVGPGLGAWCGKLLADMGASVIKIEPPSGDATRGYEPFYRDEPGVDRSLYFWHYNTNKSSVTLDIETNAGRAVFRRLAADADVIIDSTPPGHMRQIGLGYDEITDVAPSIVMASISPFGQEGPYVDWASTDLTALAFGGPVWNCGYDDHTLPPVRGGGNQGYHVVCHYAVNAIMIALIHRQFTGVGQYIDANMHAALNVTTEGASYNWLVARDTVQRQTGRHAAVVPTSPTQVLCQDGRYVNVGFPARTEEQWLHLLAWLDEEDLLGNLGDYLDTPNWTAMRLGDPDALEQQRRVSLAMAALAGKTDSYDLFSKAQELGFQWGIVYAPEDVFTDPHFQARGFPVEVEHPELGESFVYPGAPYKLPASPWAITRRAPLLGEDNQRVLGNELGLGADEIATLRGDGVV